jgi:hypothetical protein
MNIQHNLDFFASRLKPGVQAEDLWKLAVGNLSNFQKVPQRKAGFAGLSSRQQARTPLVGKIIAFFIFIGKNSLIL